MFSYILTAADGARTEMPSGDAYDTLESFVLNGDVDDMVQAAAMADLFVAVDESIDHLIKEDDLSMQEKVNILQADFDDDLTEDEWTIVADYYKNVYGYGDSVFDPASLKDSAMEAAVIPVKDWDSDTRIAIAEYVMDGGDYWSEIPEHLRAYFDMESYGRDILINDMSEGDNWVFWNH